MRGMANPVTRAALLDILNELAAKVVFGEREFFELAAQRLDVGSLEAHHATLDAWHDFYRTGLISWGLNIDDDPNRSLAWAHLTSLGKKTVAERSRDPANAEGYLANIDSVVPSSTIARSYIEESLRTYNAGCDKATAVLVGAAAESISIELRDELVSKMKAVPKSIPKDMTSWQIKTALDAVEAELRKCALPKKLEEQFDAFWSGLAGSIRMSRNDAGHPKSVAPVTREEVHAMLLMFPRHAQLTLDLKSWVVASYV